MPTLDNQTLSVRVRDAANNSVQGSLKIRLMNLNKSNIYAGYGVQVTQQEILDKVKVIL
ncbi:MAG: hypothetical protein Q4B28_01125 [bacterium]|nr:hypothetical protein [bacterium]